MGDTGGRGAELAAACVGWRARQARLGGLGRTLRHFTEMKKGNFWMGKYWINYICIDQYYKSREYMFPLECHEGFLFVPFCNSMDIYECFIYRDDVQHPLWHMEGIRSLSRVRSRDSTAGPSSLCLPCMKDGATRNFIEYRIGCLSCLKLMLSLLQLYGYRYRM